MKWLNKNDDESHYEDRRGKSSKKKAALGGGIGTVIVLAIYLFTGQDFSPVLNVLNGAGAMGVQSEVVDPERANENEDLKVFSLRVFNSANDVWEQIFTENGAQYRTPTFVTFTDYTTSACGGASEQTGPFYCPGDEKVYIDLNFFHELASRFHAPGELAMAYVTAHEVGHHIQKLLGTSDQVQSQRGRISQKEYNALSVRLELQADFFAGIWVNRAVKMGIIKLEKGDVESALGAANAVGDDTLQKQAQGHVVPDAFTHGTAKQRQTWFMKGYQTGDVSQGDTFNAVNL